MSTLKTIAAQHSLHWGRNIAGYGLYTTPANERMSVDAVIQNCALVHDPKDRYPATPATAYQRAAGVASLTSGSRWSSFGTGNPAGGG